MRMTILRLRNELGLTILLSSHLLTEVEQLCTRIAVMSKGRKVFEGSIAETRQQRPWVRLRAGSFDEAERVLREANLIEAGRDGKFVLPREGVATNRIVECLV